MTAEEEELIDEMMTVDFRLREKLRQRRRTGSKRAEKQPRVVKSGRVGDSAALKIRCIR